MSIRLRLTLLYSVILAVTLLAFSSASYVTVATDTQNRLVDTLESKASRIVTADGFQFDDIKGLAHQFAGPEIYVQTRDATGKIIDRTSNLAANSLPIDETDIARIVAGTAWVDTASINGERRLIYNLPVLDQPAGNGLLQISNSLTDRDRSLNNLAQVLLAGNVLVILAAFGTGWLFAGVGLHPIFRLAEAVLAIGRTRDFARRVNYRGADDEIGQLANTFDLMLSDLEDAHRQTEKALNAQKRFVADASHELRTPLTTIRGNLELLRREPPISSRDRIEVLVDLAEETDRLIRLVNNLLMLARADAQPPSTKEPVHLQSLLEHVERQMQQVAPGRNVHFEPVFTGHGASITALVNEDALKQVLLILLDNAVKHTPPSAHISVSSIVSDTKVTIRVCDTGPGIPEKDVPRIFERFYVVDAARTQDSTGLGLAIAKTLIESQNGQLAATSSPYVGTTFEVTLPCQRS